MFRLVVKKPKKWFQFLMMLNLRRCTKKLRKKWLPDNFKILVQIELKCKIKDQKLIMIHLLELLKIP